MTKINQWGSAFLLVITAIIWGVAFVAQSIAADYIKPFTFNTVRCLIGGFVLILSYAIGFLIEFIISRFTNGIKNNPVKKTPR